MKLQQAAGRPRVFSMMGLGLLAMLTAGTALPETTQAADLGLKLKDRVLLHRNAPRGMEYVPTSRAGSSAKGKTALKVKVVRKINLDGNAIDNAYSSLLPIDSNNDGKYGFVHWNGHRIMRVYDPAGKKLWQVTNGSARRQGSEAFIHRDTAAIMNMNGNKKPDILHCWQKGSSKVLVAREGATGKEIRRVTLDSQSNGPTAYCRIAIYRQQSNKKPIILVAHQQPGGSGKCSKKNWVDNWTRVVAFDTNLKKLWHRDTCHAGHQTAGVDANNDGYHEYFFVGKYAMDFKGKVRCTLSGWPSGDHVDAVRIAKLSPKSSQLTAVAVGHTGGGAFNASNCKRLWKAPVKNPQELAIAQLDPAPKDLSITMTQRGTEKNPKTYVLNKNGKVVRTISRRILPMQNAQLDGDKRTDELVAMFGEVFNGSGKPILTKGWYWNLKGNKVKEKSTSNVYDRWVAFPILFDVDNDKREEIVTWGQSLIVVGRPG
ncbi:hypothetical protein [Geminicoccus harenae]|uniref:hypothetical protein n=1 Tax=Geminicoccus harenae TaxID=2498453 RepID=UPI00168A8D87|nr:hypothetical protein [Geminicoccus harenae]